MDRKNKVGGILDRRFGENDPTMTPEERAAERYARESQKKLRKESMFNLEDDEDDELQLTHMGQSLSFNDAPKDDFEDGDLDGSGDGQSDSETPRKRKRVFVDGYEAEEGSMEGAGEEDEEPERKKSKNEVMKEIIAKSKFHKAERQQIKEDDADLRDELDKGLPDLFDILRGVKPPPEPEPAKDDTASMNPDRAALLEGRNPEKEYDQRLKQLTFDKRSQPTDRTKTAEEKIAEEAERLKKLEEDRVRRMRGEQESESEEEDEDESGGEEDSEEESIPDDAKAFGLQQPTGQTTTLPDTGVEDEDDFIIDDDLVETRSDVSLSVGESDIEDEEASDEESAEEGDDEEDELINGLTLPDGKAGSTSAASDGAQGADGKLAFTYPCPEDHESFLETIEDVPVEDLPTVVQRIRALHHPRLHSNNKRKLGRFAEVLVQHVAYMAEQPERPPFAILESILRHIHSLAKSHPENVSMAFRARLRELSTERPLNLRPSDLVILTGISAIFPTSDHFHAIATPAHLCIARYLGQGAINTLSDLATGAYASSLFLQYQAISKRYMPEFVNYVLNALCNFCPGEAKKSLGFFPIRTPEESVQLSSPSKQNVTPRKLRFWDVVGPEPGKEEELKTSLLTTFTTLLDTASDLWTGQSAYPEIFEPVLAVLTHLRKSLKPYSPSIKDTLQITLDKLTHHLAQARLTRRPLFLHNHARSRSKRPSPSSKKPSTRTSITTRIASVRRRTVCARSSSARRRVRCASCARMRISWRASSCAKRRAAMRITRRSTRGLWPRCRARKGERQRSTKRRRGCGRGRRNAFLFVMSVCMYRRVFLVCYFILSKSCIACPSSKCGSIYCCYPPLLISFLLQ